MVYDCFLRWIAEDESNCKTVCIVTFVALVRMTVPVTDKKHPTSLHLGITSLVISGHSGKPEDPKFNKIKMQDL